MNSTDILLNNLKKYFLTDSLRILSKKLNISVYIILNWSSGRSSPNIKNVDQIAYLLGVATYQLLIPNNSLSINTPIWKDTLNSNLLENLGKLKNEKDIHERSFYEENLGHGKMAYRSFLRYVNGQYKRINLKTLDILADIFSVQSFELIQNESENKYEEKN